MGATPSFGIPYPESTDYAAGGAAAIQELAEAVEFRTRMTWFTLTLPAGQNTHSLQCFYGHTYAEPPMVFITGYNRVAGGGDPDNLYPTNLFNFEVFVNNSYHDYAQIVAFWYGATLGYDQPIHLGVLIVPTAPE